MRNERGYLKGKRERGQAGWQRNIHVLDRLAFTPAYYSSDNRVGNPYRKTGVTT